MKKICFGLIALLICFFTFMSCSNTVKYVDFGYSGTPVFGSIETINITGKLYGKNLNSLKNARKEIVENLRAINTEINTVDSNSVIYKFNEYGNVNDENETFLKEKKFPISEHIYNMLTVAQELYNNTENKFSYTDINYPDITEIDANRLFNPAIYRLLKLWKLDAQSLHNNETRDKIPTTAEIKNVLPFTDFEKIHFGEDENGYFITKDIPELMLDFGGQAKGYGADLVIEICKKYNLISASFDIGGNAYVYKSKPIETQSSKGYTNIPWTVAINMPINPKNLEIESSDYFYFCALEIENTSLVTSGDYIRNFKFDGVKYAHILNPFTGLPLNIERIDDIDQNTEGLTSVTIIHPNSELADIYAKIVIMLGMTNGIKYMQDNDLRGVLIGLDNQYAVVGDLKLAKTSVPLGYIEYTPYENMGFVQTEA